MTAKPQQKRIRYLSAALLALFCGPGWAGELSLTTGLDTSSGKYGGTASTVVRYVPFTVKYEQGRSTYKVTLPYVSITSPSGGGTVSIDGNGNIISSGGAGPSVTQSGLGDVVGSYSYSLIEEPLHGWLMDATVKVKLPTGDEAKGLSTGERDFTVLADFYYPAGKWTPFVTLGYRMPGNPPGGTLRNTWLGSLGVGHKLSQTNSAGFMFDAREATSANSVGSRELTAYWVHKFTPQTKFQLYAVKGFSDASADYGLGAMLTHKY
ncbi:MAG: hypothetical protein B7Y41_09825 [Hydrogenophilales bacterium 28-61-23]|nr:MAG: hypothetical protein B7Y41_09825 [Hydrogenophilales bacterium 28-61-23]